MFEKTSETGKKPRPMAWEVFRKLEKIECRNTWWEMDTRKAFTKEVQEYFEACGGRVPKLGFDEEVFGPDEKGRDGLVGCTGLE